MNSKWEYRIINIFEGDDLGAFDRTLTQAGAEGWEIVSVVPWQKSARNNQSRVHAPTKPS